jgi:hypothetical protein
MWASPAITPQRAVVVKQFFALVRKKFCRLSGNDLQANARLTELASGGTYSQCCPL